MKRLAIIFLLLPSALQARELTNCEKAEAYFKAAACSEPFVRCDAEMNWSIIAGQSMHSSVSDQMRTQAALLRAQAQAYQALCLAERKAEK